MTERLTRVNRMVLRKYKKASDLQKQQMIKILKEQMNNLEILYVSMELEL